MNILVSANDEYIKPLIVMLCSLFEQEKTKINIYLLYSDVSRQNLAKLTAFICRKGGKFIPVCVKAGIFDDAPVWGYFTKEIYYRILCSELLPQSLERILYLDSDMLICNSIRELYEMDFCGKMLIGVTDQLSVNRKKIHRKKEALGLTEDDIYINSGVILFNLVKMRKEFVLKDFLVDVEKHKDILVFPDQDAINLYFRGDIGVAGWIYNYPAYWSFFFRHIIQFAVRNPSIIHYMGNIKPWNIRYIGRYFNKYYYYLRQFQSKKERGVMLLKPFFSIVELLGYVCRYVFCKNELKIDYLESKRRGEKI